MFTGPFEKEQGAFHEPFRNPKRQIALLSAALQSPRTRWIMECGHGALGGRSYRLPILSATQRSPRTARYPPYQGFMVSMHVQLVGSGFFP